MFLVSTNIYIDIYIYIDARFETLMFKSIRHPPPLWINGWVYKKIRKSHPKDERISMTSRYNDTFIDPI